MVQVLLWVVVLVVMTFTAVRRARGAVAAVPQFDVAHFYLPAAEAVESGGSPYDVVGYIYSPAVAWTVAGLRSLTSGWATIWAVMPVCATVVTGVIGGWTLARHDRWWEPPLAVLVATMSLMSSWLLTLELFLGQVNAIVMMLVVAAWAAVRGRPGLAGSLLGIGFVVKSWPVLLLVLVSLPGTLRRRVRLRLWVGAGAVVAPFMVVVAAVLGPSGIAEWVWASRSGGPVVGRLPGQVATPSYSPIGLFRALGVNGPVLDAPVVPGPVQYVLPILLVAAALAAAVWAGRAVTADNLAWWHLAAVALFLLPQAHATFFLYLVPIMWTWVTRCVHRPDRVSVLMAVVMVGWWFVLVRQGSGSGTAPPWWTYAAVLLIHVGAMAASMAADRWWARGGSQPGRRHTGEVRADKLTR